MQMNWRNALVGGLTVVATAVGAWEAAIGLAEMSWGAEWAAKRALEPRAKGFWEDLKRLGDQKVAELEAMVALPEPPLEALARRPEVAFVAMSWPDGRAEALWSEGPGPLGRLRLQGPPGQVPWQKQRPRQSVAVPQKHSGGQGHWSDWAHGAAWPGWKQVAAQNLDPKDHQLLARVGTHLFIAQEHRTKGWPWPSSTHQRYMVSRRGPGPLVVVALGELGPLSAEGHSFVPSLRAHQLHWALHPLPFDAHGLPITPGLEDHRNDPALAHAALRLEAPKGKPGPGGGAWPDMGFRLTEEALSEGWEATWRTRGVAALLAWILALGGLLAWSRGPNAGRAFLPAMELIALSLVVAFSAWMALAMGAQAHAAWQARAGLPQPLVWLPLGGFLNLGDSDMWLSALRALLGWGVVAFGLHRMRLAYPKLVEAGAADFAASALAAGVAHELRTPLAAVRVDAELLAHDLAPADQRPGISKRLLASVRRLEGRLEDVMAFARLQSHGRAVTEPYSPQDLAEAALQEAAPLLAEAGLEAKLEGSAPQGPWYGDPSALRRALVELLANAAKHGQGPLLLELSPQGWAVRDHGPGVPAAQLRAIFRPFERGSSTTKGAGLGLALVASTAKAHHGQASAELAEGGGLRVRLHVRPQG